MFLKNMMSIKPDRMHMYRARPVFRSRNNRNVPEYSDSGISVIPGIFRNTDHGWGLGRS